MKLEDKNYRTIHIDGNRANEDNRTVPASLSSDTPIMRSFGNETLVHDEKSIDMTRAKRGLPLLFSHDSDKPIGRVEGITLDEGKLRGNLRFAKNKRAEECWQDVKDGILTDVSIGYRINDYEETEDGIRATNWLIYEASVVTCPADSNVGIYRSNPAPKQEEATMDKTETPNSEAPTGDSVVVDIQMASKRALDKGTEAGIRAERNRVSDINSIFEFHQGDEVRALQSKCIDDGLTLEQSQRSLLLMLGGQAEPLASDFKQTGYRNEVVMGKTDVEKTMKGMQDVLYKRAGLGDDIDVSGNEFLGHDLSSMARETLRVAGVSTRGMDNYSIVGTAFKRDVTETAFDKAVADFPSLLADVANKSLLKGYNESEESWQRWCATGSLPDFKTGNRPNLSLYPTPAEVAENGAFALADMSDWNETIALKTVGSIFSITRQAIVNDDLSAFTRIPRAQGRAAARSVGDSVYALLTATVTMGDSNLLFDDVNHSNVYSAGAPSVATVDLIRTGMALQTDPAAIALGIRPAYLICPIALEGVATTLRNAQFDPDTAEASGNTSGNRPNWVAGTFEVVPEHRLDANSATIWYMAASSSIYDTVEVDFLNGVNAPMLESRDGFKIDGVEMKVRLDYGVAPLDWRTLAINGAAPV